MVSDVSAFAVSVQIPVLCLARCHLGVAPASRRQTCGQTASGDRGSCDLCGSWRLRVRSADLALCAMRVRSGSIPQSGFASLSSNCLRLANHWPRKQSRCEQSQIIQASRLSRELVETAAKLIPCSCHESCDPPEPQPACRRMED